MKVDLYKYYKCTYIHTCMHMHVETNKSSEIYTEPLKAATKAETANEGNKIYDLSDNRRRRKVQPQHRLGMSDEKILN